MKWRQTSWLLVVPLLAGCLANGMAPAPEGVGETPRLQADRLTVNNDPALLDARVQYLSKPLFIRKETAPGHQIAPPSKSTQVQLTEVGEILPPTVDGHVVQANDIDIYGKTAVVAYNFAGDVFAGAVQVIDFTQPDRPRLVSEVLFRNADVTSVLLHGNNVYVGQGSADPALRTPALLEEFELGAAGLAPTDRWLDMPSWVVTDLARHGTYVVASVGARDGGVALVDRTGSDLRVVSFAAEDDVRGIDPPDDQSIAAVCGTRPRLGVHGLPGMQMLHTTTVEGYNNPDAKGTIELHDSICYMGAGDGGFQVRRPDGVLLAALHHEDFSKLRPEDMVTNAVSVQGELAFVAGGALGIQVVKVAGARSWAVGGGPDPDGLEVLGQLGFEDGMSSNMVKSANNVMVVAAGLGGIKLVVMRGGA
jgi:hypothetical protein